MNAIRRLRRLLGEAGSSAVEFALVAPLVTGLMIGVLETSNALSVWLTLKKATELGARFATTGQGEIDGTRMAQIIAATKKVAADSRGIDVNVKVSSWAGLSASGAAREGDPGGPCDTVQIDVNYVYTPVTPLGDMLDPTNGASAWSQAMTMRQATRMVNEPWRPCPY
ncbi:hypothetical protein NNJEOMEG_03836 [Fundidesulfovibrio magnetotacticus]|uniref:TadE-like domain-containing protein n=1 Tax=Fundidesulfovibrio magnetotacticus TaxID=2730080 RepID=A0A6V8LU79_9BACT|nr:TadE family protein [Fundidesulfovibrio magnetotacticus]GFK95963.1 hypothetical protein NNJEOMEG_03836 [Fundidesulfovibrio magnetotacticus]